ncbi:class I SAM-dependent methyltransferase [Dactylosporangium sp. AC04546]|uniref:class I SAM-dependent methyltransferase n=1 Tax=Dactylosporangium sp. AC04546 TaxID=2862460 RepID=UPI001EDDB858|nr:class I SAM-dependent methyltransferase [Dactylosporangium sp. AC04546]WVK81250.1 class I SAM-dependent methyltransferase [Dactylosporangium sp. AC04546]
MRFEDLVAEAQAVPLRGWDFTWLAGRTTGSDPTWSYPDLAGELLHARVRLLDIDTGGGELLASFAPLPAGGIAVEGWAPNVPVARERLEPLGVAVRYAPDGTLPVEDHSVDLVLNRHGRLDATEVARVLAPGGTLLTQQVGSDDCTGINQALGDPAAETGQALDAPARGGWDARTAADALTAAGLTVTDVREERPPFTFHDVGALVYQLRAVPWQVPDFTVERYEAPLRRIHDHIRAHGGFRVHAHRFLIRARR